MRRLRDAVFVALSAAAAAVGAVRGVRRTEPQRKGAVPARRRLRDAAILVALLAALVAFAGVVVLVAGLVPINASSGHWGITSRFLDFASDRSVATWSWKIAVPPALDDSALVLKGAGHYETGCKPCHGSPELLRPRIAGGLTPPAPYLGPDLAKWDPAELFYIVKNGIKFTGMPAWPSRHRDDEVWAMTAFLLKLPTLDAPTYARLVHGEAPAPGVVPLGELVGNAAVPTVVRESCGRCHGVDGRGRGTGAFPRLAGQRAAYLRGAMIAYADGGRHSGIMEPIAAGVREDELEAIAQFYAALPPAAPQPPDAETGAAIARGARIARRGVPEKLVPACAHCHGPTPDGHPTNENLPLLAGQYANYLELQLELFQGERRGGGAYAELMQHVARQLSRDEMRDVALYYATLDPAQSPRALAP